MSDTVIDFILKNIIWILFVGYAIFHVFKSIASAGKDIESAGEHSAEQRRMRRREPRGGMSPHSEQGGEDFDAARRMVEEMTRRAHAGYGGDSYTPSSPEDFTEGSEITDWDLRQREIRRENARARGAGFGGELPRASQSAPAQPSRHVEPVETAAAYAEPAHSNDIASQLSEIMETLKNQNSKASDMSAYAIDDSKSKKSAYAGGAFFNDASSLRRAVVASEILGKPVALRDNPYKLRY